MSQQNQKTQGTGWAKTKLSFQNRNETSRAQNWLKRYQTVSGQTKSHTRTKRNKNRKEFTSLLLALQCYWTYIDIVDFPDQTDLSRPFLKKKSNCNWTTEHTEVFTQWKLKSRKDIVWHTKAPISWTQKPQRQIRKARGQQVGKNN